MSEQRQRQNATPAVASETPLLDRMMAQAAETEILLASCRPAALAEKNKIEQAITLARGLDQLRRLFTQEIMRQVVMPLKGSRLGFMTDERENQRQYSEDEVRDAVIDALIRGAQLTGNEFNIISGGAYLTLSFFRRMLREMPELTDLELKPHVPALRDGGALVGFEARWVYKGKRQEMLRVVEGQKDNRIVVRVNKGMGSDGIIGKAERKLRAAIYAQITGSHQTLDGAVEDLDNVGSPDSFQPNAAEAAQVVLQGLKTAPAAAPAPTPTPTPVETPAPPPHPPPQAIKGKEEQLVQTPLFPGLFQGPPQVAKPGNAAEKPVPAPPAASAPAIAPAASSAAGGALAKPEEVAALMSAWGKAGRGLDELYAKMHEIRGRWGAENMTHAELMKLLELANQK